MTAYFLSGTPRNDAFQWLENKFTDYRLFSLYGAYRKPVMCWLRDVKDGINSVDAFLARYSAQRHRIEAADRIRRQRQVEQGDARDFDTIEALRAAYPMAAAYPRNIMLDSGAFTVWNAGKRVSVDEVVEAYAAFLDEAGDLFTNIWLVNLDEIPGEPRKPASSMEALRKAAEAEDANLIVLREKLARFDPHILPVIHQSRHEGFDQERLKEVLEQAAHSDHFVCVSPDNSRPEKEQVAWARAVRDAAAVIAPDVRLHGLATTGNVMSNGFGYYSVDSEAWSRHARYGSLDLYETVEKRDGTSVVRYGSYHVGVEQDAYDALTGERIPGRKASYWNLTDEEREFVHAACERYPFPFEMVQWSERARALVNMGELGCFTCWEGGRLIPQAA